MGIPSGTLFYEEFAVKRGGKWNIFLLYFLAGVWYNINEKGTAAFSMAG
jgi:hypothetical protein